MRTVRTFLVLAILSGVLAAAGCGPTVVPIKHVLPAAVPVGSGIERIEAGPFVVKDRAADGWAAFTAEALGKRLAEVQGQDQPTTATGPAARVSGDIRVRTTDRSGMRTVRSWDDDNDRLETHDIPTLVRRADVGVDFVIAVDGAAEPSVTVQVRRSYDSLGDPRVRGKLGLQRPDDPARVPDAETIIRELLTECVDSFCAMIAPLEVNVEVPLRPTLDIKGSSGIDAAGKGDLGPALRLLGAAAADWPKDVNLAFDLAVVAEAQDKLQVALEQYRRVLELTDNRDTEAADGAKRVRGVLLHRNEPIPPEK